MSNKDKLVEFVLNLTNEETEKILSTLVELYAKQEGCNIKYIIETKKQRRKYERFNKSRS